MASYDVGKEEVCAWIRKNIPPAALVLDVGACDGKWAKLLPEYTNMDAVEAFAPNAEKIDGMYRGVFVGDIAEIAYLYYDLIIFGDVIEHLTVEDAQAVLEYAKRHARNIIVSVPFQYEQDAIYDNPYEVHIQDDLTPELFDERYPGFRMILHPTDDYAYYLYRRNMS